VFLPYHMTCRFSREFLALCNIIF